MSLIGRAVVFVVREAARPALEEFGRRVGAVVGIVVGKRIDPSAFEGGDIEDLGPVTPGEGGDDEEGDDEEGGDEDEVVTPTPEVP